MKKRLDILLVERGLSETRTKAQSLIMAGQVAIDNKVVDKPGAQVNYETEIVVKERFPYVSRGALKLEKAYNDFKINFEAKIVCDIGSSTGGFTDFALQHGAKKVFAIDVGRGQLDQKIREDSRVVSLERTDFREVRKLGDKIDYFLCDVSFISLKKILPKVKELSENETSIIALIKPQFEAGAKEVTRGKGVIKSEQVRNEIVSEIKNFAQDLGYKIEGLVESPIHGAKGNVEYLIYLKLV
jgi:23S rRNA (cytidine1920-2'-O)/16S rRNA (cytidine1409-2'-O)-methyltransferase